MSHDDDDDDGYTAHLHEMKGKMRSDLSAKSFSSGKTLGMSKTPLEMTKSSPKQPHNTSSLFDFVGESTDAESYATRRASQTSHTSDVHVVEARPKRKKRQSDTTGDEAHARKIAAAEASSNSVHDLESSSSGDDIEDQDGADQPKVEADRKRTLKRRSSSDSDEVFLPGKQKKVIVTKGKSTDAAKRVYKSRKKAEEEAIKGQTYLTDGKYFPKTTDGAATTLVAKERSFIEIDEKEETAADEDLFAILP